MGSTLRVGIGFDSHCLVEGRPLVLGCERVPHDKGLAGHSDADVLAHAICDALLGAAGGEDIGRVFPDGDPRWKGVSGSELLGNVAGILSGRGLGIVNVDCTLVAEKPKIAAFADRMRSSVAAALGVEAGQVSVKGKTNEGMGFVGRQEGIAAIAVALVERKAG